MQIHASAGLPPGPAAGLPPGLLPGAPTGPAGLPSSIALLAGIPTSLAQAVAGGAGGPHPAFASLLAQQKPNLDASQLRQPGKDEELKRAIADTNGSKSHLVFALELDSQDLSLVTGPPSSSHPMLPTNLQPDERQVRPSFF